MENMQEKEKRIIQKKKIIKMLNEIQDEKVIMLIYGFVKTGFKEEKAGK